MKFIADFHIHSHYSIATSKDLRPESLDTWARIKGIKVVGTGDFTHPGWLAELEEKLEPAESGLFRLKDVCRQKSRWELPDSADDEARFILTSEISTIYKKKDRVRKVHHVLFAPDFAVVKKIQQTLSRIGNITSDGRPILGLDSRDLLEIALNVSDRIFFVPAHIWTPWFSALGAKAGFDTIAECYGDLSDHIHAVETGLSSDPSMNWMCSFLDRYTLISNSDAHSPEKLGREANLFDTEISYDAMLQALRSGDPTHFLGTLEFFPQEGKYHYDGHRKCGICWNPVETMKHKGVCPVCGRRVTVGVMNRVVQLADREDPSSKANQVPFYSIIPLKEILSEITGTGSNSQKVESVYRSLIRKMGSEYNVLLSLSIEEIQKEGNAILSEAIRRMRRGEVILREGYDGEYGQIKVFRDNERKDFITQDSLFDDLLQTKGASSQSKKTPEFDLKEYRRLKKAQVLYPPIQEESEGQKIVPQTADPFDSLNPEQRKAVEHFTGPVLIIAGPGTGKTHVLACRIVHLIEKRSIAPENILAVTFTNKAAKEMKERILRMLKDEKSASKLCVSTFHAFGFSILKDVSPKVGRTDSFTVIDEEDKAHILGKQLGCEKKQVKKVSQGITEAKQQLKSLDEIEDHELAEIFGQYEIFLREQNLFDLDDLIYHPVHLFRNDPEVLSQYRENFLWILVDEYQDSNFAQYQMIRSLMPTSDSNLCVIGDPNQAIYGFRGANVRFIRKFKEDYPGAATYVLKKSYRCSDSILMASSNIVQKDPSEKPFALEGLRKGVKIKIIQHSSDKSEAEFVARTIESMMGGLRFFSMDSDITEGEESTETGSLSDFAVLCRITREMQVLEKAFHDHSIPYQTVGDIPFFKREPVRSVLDVLRVLANPKNDYLKKELLEKKKFALSQWDDWFSHAVKQGPVQESIHHIVNQLFRSLKSEDEDILKRLIHVSEDFGNDLETFLRFTVLGTEADTYQSNLEGVTLMTLHAAKGLEFECVFIVGCEKGLIPYALFEDRPSDTDEERRLLYVGMTRARKHLFLSHAERRFLHGREYRLERSPFLDSIEKELVESERQEYQKKAGKAERQMNLF